MNSQEFEDLAWKDKLKVLRSINSGKHIEEEEYISLMAEEHASSWNNCAIGQIFETIDECWCTDFEETTQDDFVRTNFPRLYNLGYKFTEEIHCDKLASAQKTVNQIEEMITKQREEISIKICDMSMAYAEDDEE